jgi:hypothetical protein
MIPLLLLAMLPLDLAPGTASLPAVSDGLNLEAVLEGRRVGARLTNLGKRPLQILVGYTCGGPEPFLAVVDGKVLSFQTASITCTGNAMQIETLRPGAQRIIPSSTIILDGAPHHLAVRYENRAYDWNKEQWHGHIQSVAISVGGAAVDLQLRATPKPGGEVELEAIHTYNGPTQLRFATNWIGVCPGPIDSLILDGKTRSFIEPQVCDGPAGVATEAVASGGRFVTHGRIKLERGIHQLRARYEVGEGILLIAGVKGNIGDFEGVVESPEVEILVK